jgi:hypothetical protein
MTRFAWLQARTQSLTAAGLLAGLAVAAAVTGVHLSHLYEALVAHCQSNCEFATSQFLVHDRFLQQALDLVARIAPALLGIFWGAPLLAREFETGTYRLAWTQSVTRSRWVVTKLALIAFATVAIAGLLTLTITWWYRAVDAAGTNQYAVFDRRDIAPIGYAAFAFALGSLAGVIIRRTVPAMATTLGVFVFARVATSIWLRPHLLSPVRESVALLSGDQFGFTVRNASTVQMVAHGSGPLNSWTLSSHFVTNSGHVPSSAELTAFMHQYCPTVGLPPPPPASGRVFGAVNKAAFDACRLQAAHIYHLVVTYQPAGRYWTFQWLETGIFLMLALIAAIACYWWVTRRSV